MKIELDTNTLSDLDLQILALITTGTTAPAAPAEPAKPAPKKAAAPKATPAPAPEPEVPTSEEAGDTGEDEDLLAPADPASPPAAQPTMADAVAAATPLISSGKQTEVKAILSELGAKRVSELPEDKIPAFLAGLANL